MKEKRKDIQNRGQSTPISDELTKEQKKLKSRIEELKEKLQELNLDGRIDIDHIFEPFKDINFHVDFPFDAEDVEEETTHLRAILLIRPVVFLLIALLLAYNPILTELYPTFCGLLFFSPIFFEIVDIGVALTTRNIVGDGNVSSAVVITVPLYLLIKGICCLTKGLVGTVFAAGKTICRTIGSIGKKIGNIFKKRKVNSEISELEEELRKVTEEIEFSKLQSGERSIQERLSIELEKEMQEALKRQKELDEARRKEEEEKQKLEEEKRIRIKVLEEEFDKLIAIIHRQGKHERFSFPPFTDLDQHHKIINPMYFENGRYKYLNYRGVSFNEVEINGVDFRECNIEFGSLGINPQTVYGKNLRECNFEGIHIPHLGVDFTGVDIRGARFSDDGNPMTLDTQHGLKINPTFEDAIYDENTTYNGVSLVEIFGECKNRPREH